MENKLNTELDVRAIIESQLPHIDEIDEVGLKVIAMTAHGMSRSAIAKTLGVSPSIVATIVGITGFETAVKAVRDNLNAWHRKQLSTAATLAWNKIIDGLSESHAPGSPAHQAQLKLAESIVKKMIDSPVVNAEDPIEEEVVELNVSPSSVELIARRVHDLQSSGPKARNEREIERFVVENLPPVVACHPNSTYGVMTRNEDGLICHSCGKGQENFLAHIEEVHRLSYDAYAGIFGIEENVFLAASKG